LYPNYEIFPKDNDFEKSSLKAKKKRRQILYQRVSLAEKVRQEKERSIEFSKF
jgi:predicted site-specific integrase-resolvase